MLNFLGMTNSFESGPKFQENPSQALAEIHGLIGQMQAEGAVDEEMPFIQSILGDISAAKISAHEGLKQIRAKLASRGNYH